MSIIGVTKGDTRRLDYGSNEALKGASMGTAMSQKGLGECSSLCALSSSPKLVPILVPLNVRCRKTINSQKEP